MISANWALYHDLHAISAVVTLRHSRYSSLEHPAGSLVQFYSIPGKAHNMVGSPAEMRHLMGFWAQALKHRPVQANSGEAATVVEVQGGANALTFTQTTHA